MNAERKFTSEFVINNLPADQRELLLLKSTRNDICDAADVDISVRGRIIQPRSDGTLICDGNVKPLYLLIVAKSKHNLTQAMKKIQEILQNQCKGQNTNEDLKDDVLEERITVGIDVWPIHFRMRSNILGENDEFVKYIEKETGAHITLRGKGSNYAQDNTSEEPLHIHVTYDDPAKRKRTHELVLNLIETVQKDFMEKYSKYYAHPKKIEIIPIRTKNDDVWKPLSNEKPVLPEQSSFAEQLKMDDMDKIYVGFDYSPRSFDLKSKICGPNDSHFEHIENEGQVVLLLRGRGCCFPEEEDTDEPPYLHVKYKNANLKSHARDLIFNLLETVQNEFIQLNGTYPIAPQKPRIVPYDSKIPEVKRNVDRLPSVPHDSKSPLFTIKSREQASTISYDTRMPEIGRKGPEATGPISFHTRIPDRKNGREPSATSYNKGMSSDRGRGSREPAAPTTQERRIPVITRSGWEPPSYIPYNNEVLRMKSPELPASLPFDRETRKIINQEPSSVLYNEGSSEMRSVTRESPSFLLHNKETSDTRRRRRSRSRDPPTSFPYNKVRRRSRSRGPPTSISYNKDVIRRSRSRSLSTSPRKNSDHSRRTKMSPKSSKQYVSHRERSKSPVIPPPPPVISKTFPFNSHNSSHPLPPVIPPTINSTKSKPLSPPPPPPPRDGLIMSQGKDRTYDYQRSKILTELDEPTQDFDNLAYYFLQSQQPENLFSSFIKPSNNEQEQYIKKTSNSSQSITRNQYPENKMYSNPSFSNSLKTSSTSTPLNQQMNYGGEKQYFVPSSVENQFRRSQDVSSARNIPLEDDMSFNGYNFGLEKSNQSSFLTSNKDRIMKKGQKKDENTPKFQTISLDSEDSKSIICIDSEEDDYYQSEKPTSTTMERKPKTHSIQVQTDDEDVVLKNNKVQCRCGRFVPYVTGVRSRAVQTDPERYSYCRF